MVDLTNQRRLAANLLKCGGHRVWINENRLEDVAGAVTRSDIRRLIASGAIQKKQKKGISGGRALYRKLQKRKGRRMGPGTRKGGPHVKFPKKRRWIKIIRPIRAHLVELKKAKAITVKNYRLLYRQAKGGMFKNKAHVDAQLRARNLLNDDAMKKLEKKWTERRTEQLKKSDELKQAALKARTDKSKKAKAEREYEGPGKKEKEGGEGKEERNGKGAKAADAEGEPKKVKKPKKTKEEE